MEDDLNVRMSTNGKMILTGENKQSQFHFVHEKFQTHWSGTETEPPTNPVTKRLSHDTASMWRFLQT